MIKLIDIAHQLKLSRVTVSAVLNGRYKSLGISEATAERVIKTARDLGYRRNEMAMSMKTGKSFLVGCMTGALHVEWGGRVLEGALLGMRDSAYSMKIESVHSPEDDNAALQRFLGARVAGIFVCNINPGMSEAAKLKHEFERYKIPIVCNNSRSDLSPFLVEPDNIGGSLLAVEHLAKLGHKQIAYISGDELSNTSLLRRDGFLQALGKCNLSLGPNHLERGNWDFQETAAAAERLIKADQAPTAIICANDEMAAVTIRTIQQAGLRVPEDISVIGFTNERLSRLTNPPITTISQPEVEVGRTAMEMLIQKIEASPEERLEPETRILPSEIIVRDSTARPPKKK